MDENYKIINEFVNKYKDTLVIDFDKIKVLRNFINGEDSYNRLRNSFQLNLKKLNKEIK